MILIFKKKILDTVLEFKFIVFFILAFLLLLFSTFSGFSSYASAKQAYDFNQSQLETVMANRGSYVLMQSEGITLRRPPEKMSIFFRGVTNSTGDSAPVNDMTIVTAVGSRNELHPLLAALGDLDYGYIFKFIFSLFAMVLAFDVVSGEKERGTLKLILSNPVRRSSFILATTVGGILVLWIAILIPLLLSVLAGQMIFNVSFTGNEWLLFSSLIMVNFLYLAIMYMVGLTLSSLLKSSFSSFLFSLAVWIVVVGIIPVFSIEIASRISPAPSIDELEAETAALKRANSIFLKDKMYESMKAVLDRDLRDSDGRRAAAENATQEAQQEFLRKEAVIFRNYVSKQLALATTAKRLSRVSPASVVSFAASNLAGTDEQLLNRFLEDVRRYRVKYLNYAARKAADNFWLSMSGTGRSISIDTNDEGILEFYEVEWFGPNQLLEVADSPDFESASPDPISRLSAAFPDIGILIAELLFLVLASVILFNRYDVR